MNEELNLKQLATMISDPAKVKKTKPTPKQAPQKKKSEISNREILALTGGFFPIQPYNSGTSTTANKKDLKGKKVQEWVYCPIYFKEGEASDIFHWAPKTEAEKVYPFNKFRITAEVVTFTDDEYEKHLKGVDPSWTKEETLYLWELLHRFDLRFIVVADRYDEKYNRTIEELKERYYAIAKKLLEVRGDKQHPLANFNYSKEFEKQRKIHFEKYLLRPKEKNEEERKILDEIRKLDTIIKKEEKEQGNLEKLLKFVSKEEPGSIEEEFASTKEPKKEIKTGKKIAYLRGNVMHAALPFSQRVNEKVNMILNELSIPPKPMPTAENEKLYDELRQNILMMFSLQKHLKKKEQEKKDIEEKNLREPATRPIEDTGDKRRGPHELADKPSAQKKQKLN